MTIRGLIKKYKQKGYFDIMEDARLIHAVRLGGFTLKFNRDRGTVYVMEWE
jgi:hypothetical protein